ncbi:hypothetical protein ACA910_003101 [Epithemia clementina (nom. ined.)]
MAPAKKNIDSSGELAGVIIQEWSAHNYPFESNYNDHFETPLAAYRDLLPLLELVQSTISTARTEQSGLTVQVDTDTTSCHDNPFTLYDPYFCNGRAKALLKQVGFPHVVHEKRDFYKDIQQKRVPKHDAMITNPPYSDEHKQKCLQYCLAQTNTPFFLLMPNYVATRHYFRSACLVEDPTSEHLRDHHIVYLAPSSTYEYSHPEGTGHDKSPFQSLWFCGLPKKSFSMEKVQSLDFYNKPYTCKLFVNWPSLVQNEGLLVKRPNPKQRRRKRSSQVAVPSPKNVGDGSKEATSNGHICMTQTKPKPSKRSKYRDESGQRKKKRF